MQSRSLREPTVGFDLDRLAARLLRLVSILSGLLLLWIVAFLLIESWPVIAGGGWHRFFNSDGWYPLEQKLGLLPMLYASIVVTLGALIIALPTGLATAVFIEYFSPSFLAKPFTLLVSLMAAIPSVVFGLWGLTVLVPLVAQIESPGTALITAILVLAMMILPTVALTSRSALTTLSAELRQGAAALAMSRSSTICWVLIPAAWRGIAGGLLLAIARALGETMAVLMVAGNVVQTPTSLFDPVRVLTANIALEMGYATEEHRAALLASGLLLMLLVLIVAWLSQRLTAGTKQ